MPMTVWLCLYYCMIVWLYDCMIVWMNTLMTVLFMSVRQYYFMTVRLETLWIYNVLRCNCPYHKQRYSQIFNPTFRVHFIDDVYKLQIFWERLCDLFLITTFVEASKPAYVLLLQYRIIKHYYSRFLLLISA